MSLKRTSPPEVPAATLEEARDYARLASSEDDALLSMLLRSAVRRVEQATGRALIRQSWRETRTSFDDARRLSDCAAAFALARPPLISVGSVRVRAADGSEESWDPAEYRVDAEADPGRLIAVSPFGFPRAEPTGGQIVIDFTAGYGDAPSDVPDPLREAVLRLTAAAYERGERDAGRAPRAEDVERLIAPYRSVLP